MKIFGRIVDGIEDVFFKLAIAIVSFMVLSVTVDVFLRYFFLKPIRWQVEINEYLLVQITFLASAFVLRREGHVVIDIVLSRVSARTQAKLNLVSSCLGVVLCLVLAFYGSMTTLEHIQEGTLAYWTVVGMPLYAVNAVIPLGCFLLSLQFIRRANQYLTMSRSANTDATE